MTTFRWIPAAHTAGRKSRRLWKVTWGCWPARHVHFFVYSPVDCESLSTIIVLLFHYNMLLLHYSTTPLQYITAPLLHYNMLLLHYSTTICYCRSHTALCDMQRCVSLLFSSNNGPKFIFGIDMHNYSIMYSHVM